MSERYTPPEVIAAVERAAVAKRFSESSKYFDPEFFMEGYDKMAAEFDAADRAGRRMLLTERYFDGFAPVDDQQIIDSQFEDRFCVRPQPYPIDTIPGAKEGVVDPSNTLNLHLMKDGQVWQQGPTRAFDVPNRKFIEIKSAGRQDVIGATAMAWGLVIVARDGSRLAMAKASNFNPGEIPKSLATIYALGYSPKQVRLLSLFETRGHNQEISPETRRLQEFAEQNDLQVDWIAPRSARLSRDVVLNNSTQFTVLAGRDQLWSVRTDFRTRYVSKKGGSIAQQRTEVERGTYRDYE